jgi:hypothetical protein
MKYKHTVLSIYQRRSNLLQRTEGGARTNLALRKYMLESQDVPGTYSIVIAPWLWNLHPLSRRVLACVIKSAGTLKNIMSRV